MSTRIVNLKVLAGMIGRGAVAAGIAIVLLAVPLTGCTQDGGEQEDPAPENAADVSPRISEAEIAKSLNAAEQYFNAGENAKARVILTRLVRDAPANLSAREFLGQVYAAEGVAHEQAGRVQDAIDARANAWAQYREAVTLAPQQAGLHHSAALMALAAGERDAAIELLREATRLEPANPQFPLYLAQLLIQDGELDDAQALIHAAIGIAPDEPHLHATLGAIEMERGKFDDALIHVREARTIAPDELAFRVQEAKILRRAGRSRDALTLLMPLRETERSQEYVAWEIAENLTSLDDAVGAAQAWELCFRTTPLHPNAWEWAVRIGELLVDADRTHEAAMWLEEAVHRNSSAPEVQALRQRIELADGS